MKTKFKLLLVLIVAFFVMSFLGCSRYNRGQSPSFFNNLLNNIAPVPRFSFFDICKKLKLKNRLLKNQ